MTWLRLSIILFFTAVFSLVRVQAITVVINTPGGPISVDVAHAGPTGQLVEPNPPSDAGFRPPTIFAAPLPVGSGARALGQAGAFTAVADDATAASWNPAGLTQLERPEISAVYRFSAREDTHESKSADLDAGHDQYHSSELNYLSAVYPFLLGGQTTVVSLNYQESYDFTYEFNARFKGNNQEDVNATLNQLFTQSTTNVNSSPFLNITLITETTTDAQSDVAQILDSSILSGIDFQQRGTIDAISPSFAIDLHPRFSLGVTLNVYTDGASRGNPIESELVANYAGTSDSMANIFDTRISTAIVSLEGEAFGGPPGNPTTNLISQTDFIPAFTNTDINVRNDAYTVDGVYREKNRTEDFYGVNATIGALWAATDKLSLGISLDLPWTGHGKQSKQTNHQVSTFDSNLVQIASSQTVETRKSDVEYTFPLYWSVGALWKWSDRFYTSLDVSQTYWSDYSYKAEGEERINPISGEKHTDSSIDDCWSVRLGGEFLFILSWTEIPLRGGLFWEQRPAIDTPDEYWGFSLGSGLSLGKEPGRAVLDIAYIFEQGNNVQGTLLSDQSIRSDIIKHQIFCSAIWHF